MRMKKLAPKKSVRAKHTWGWRDSGAAAIGVAAIIVAVGAMLSAAKDSREPDAVATNARATTTAVTGPQIRTISDTGSTKDPASTTASKTPEPVTIAGCLERDDETFRLKNTTGTQAPKGRSWKSGFLKKNASTIAVVDTSNKVQLGSHVGQRVSVTGMLVDREIKVRSLRRVAASCSQEA
jgi:hypothetical protein